MASSGASSYPPRSPIASPAGLQAHQQGSDGVIIAGDDTYLEDGDSAIGSEGSSCDTSLSPSVTDYQYENGRRYHAIREGAYVLPNDEAESDRLNLQHQMLYMLFGLHMAPLDNPQRILDIGTGTGIWAVEMADKFPSSEVIGNDLSPIQPSFIPPNLRFEVDDAESDWAHWHESFDYIHMRYMIGSIKDWPKLLQQSYRHTRPGGFVELQEFNLDLYADNGSLDSDNAVKRWADHAVEAARINDRPINIGKKLRQIVQDAGFVNVQQKVYKLPLGPWPKDSKLKEIGTFNLVNFLDGLEASSLALFTRMLRWSAEEVMGFLLEVRKDIHRRDIHMMFDVYVIWGQKPES